ncbi:unnamed protein product [Parnassius apollo]|uniref:(apollo) hypothetical protein n=1 Tax=Parnassius apollo TaxID=110799 RepID=A0A8S3WN09_PARAO|nr:unnamed protein product [Parnassius apollo]
MCEIIFKEHVTRVVNNVVIACNLKDWSYLEGKLDNIAQNYFGVIIPVVIEGKKKDNDGIIRLKLVLKLAPTDERYRISGAITTMFEREVFVYSEVFRIFEGYQQHLKADSQYTIPKCYYVCQEYCKEAIAMQNMCEIGYKPFVHSLFLDVDHTIVSLKCLAKFHALSFILIYKEGDIYENVKKICLPLSEKTNKRYIDILVDRLEKAICKFENSNYVPLLSNLKQNCRTYIESAYLSSEKNCLCHGDIWKENILFKYKDKLPVSACLIDFQTVRLCSPAFDVLYLITSSTSSELRKECYSALLDIYYKTLLEFLYMSKFDKVITYSNSQFYSDLKLVAPACLIVANTALWLWNGLQEEGHVRSKQIWHTESEKAKAVDQYKAVIKGIIDDFRNYGYLPVMSNGS